MKMDIKTVQKQLSNIIKLIALLIILILCILLLKSRGTSVNTQTALYGTAENKFNTDGFLIRNETLINAPSQGVLSLDVQENERVAAGQVIATIFNGDVDEETRNKLKKINERILELENSIISKVLVVGDSIAADSTIKSRADDIISASYYNDLSKVSQYKDDITTLLSDKAGSTGNNESEENTTSAVDNLKKEKNELEKTIAGGRVEITATVPGVFSSEIDGYEDYFDIAKITSLKPSDLNNAKDFKPEVNKEVVKGNPCVKISDNFEWYFAANVDGRWGSDIKEGENVSLRFPGISDALISAYIKSVSAIEDGKVTVVVACSDYIEDIYNLREINADIVRRTYRGFKIPKEAVREGKDGKMGVFVVVDKVAKFRNINVVYTGDNYIIAAEDNKLENPLLLYDEIIVTDGEITEGTVVK